MVNGALYVSTSLSQVAAIDAATGNTLWVYDPETWKNGTPSNNGFVHRGVAYWAGGDHQRSCSAPGTVPDLPERPDGQAHAPPSANRDALT